MKATQPASAWRLAEWILHHAEGPVTHLKLQKLVFYCYSICLAHGADDELGVIDFRAWQHGPVNYDLWQKYRAQRANPLSPSSDTVTSYSKGVETLLHDVLSVYGVLDAWSLRNESHLERPWQQAYHEDQRQISKQELQRWAKDKFCGGNVPFPEYLLHAGNLKLEGAPILGYRSFSELAQAVRRSLERAKKEV